MDGMMEKGGTEPADLSERPQEAGGDKSAGGSPPQRFSAKRKLRAVSRLLRGEPVELLARELDVTAARLSEWRERALLAAEAALKERERDDRDDEITRLKGKVGEMTMETELLREKIARLEAGAPLDAGGRGDERGGLALRGSGVRPGACRPLLGQPCIVTSRHRPARNAAPVPWDLATMPPCCSISGRRSPRVASPARAAARSGRDCALPASAAHPGGCAA